MQYVYILYIKKCIILYYFILYVGKIIVIFVVINHFHWLIFNWLKFKLLFLKSKFTFDEISVQGIK